jgi:hypothetical protein
MKKRILVVLMCVFVMFTMCGCKTNAETNNVSVFESITIYVDEETGVNYMLYDGYDSGGITPRYNEDGSLYVTGN